MKIKSFYFFAGLQTALILCFLLLLVHFFPVQWRWKELSSITYIIDTLPMDSTKNYTDNIFSFVPYWFSVEQSYKNVNEDQLAGELIQISEKYLKLNAPKATLEKKIIMQTNDLFCFTINGGKGTTEWKVAINIAENSSYRVAVFT